LNPLWESNVTIANVVLLLDTNQYNGSMFIPHLHNRNILGKSSIVAHAISREYDYFVISYYGIKFGYIFKSFEKNSELIVDAFVSFNQACLYTPSHRHETE